MYIPNPREAINRPGGTDEARLYGRCATALGDLFAIAPVPIRPTVFPASSRPGRRSQLPERTRMRETMFLDRQIIKPNAAHHGAIGAGSICDTTPEREQLPVNVSIPTPSGLDSMKGRRFDNFALKSSRPAMFPSSCEPSTLKNLTFGQRRRG